MSDYNTNQNSNGSGGDIIAGVDCKVSGCKYHHPGGACSASNIKVEAPNASDKMDTYCGSFAAQDFSSSAGSSVPTSANNLSGSQTPDRTVFGGEGSVYGSDGSYGTNAAF